MKVITFYFSLYIHTYKFVCDGVGARARLCVCVYLMVYCKFLVLSTHDWISTETVQTEAVFLVVYDPSMNEL
jgi:hypothetical protein